MKHASSRERQIEVPGDPLPAPLVHQGHPAVAHLQARDERLTTLGPIGLRELLPQELVPHNGDASMVTDVVFHLPLRGLPAPTFELQFEEAQPAIDVPAGPALCGKQRHNYRYAGCRS
jgi:hypothetical protein